MYSIDVQHIGKKYGKVKALDDVSLQIAKGELFGLIGPDGAGKTSLFRILTTLTLPDEGSATVEGLDVVKDYPKIRPLVGYMPGKFSLYEDLSVEENLDFFATIFGTSVSANYSTIQDIYSQLEPFRKRKAGKLSGGMKQKLALCCALVHRPAVLFLDEPTTGVDAVSRGEFWNILKRIQADGVSVMVSTPYMDEASLCDRIALIQSGKIIDTGDVESIVAKYPFRLFSVSGEPIYPLLKFLRQMEETVSCFAFGSEHHLAVSDSRLTVDDISRRLSQAGFDGCRVAEIRPGIEDCFMQLAKRK